MRQSDRQFSIPNPSKNQPDKQALPNQTKSETNKIPKQPTTTTEPYRPY